MSKEPQLGTCMSHVNLKEPHVYYPWACAGWKPMDWPLPTDRATEPADSPPPPPLEGAHVEKIGPAVDAAAEEVFNVMVSLGLCPHGEVVARFDHAPLLAIAALSTEAPS